MSGHPLHGWRFAFPRDQQTQQFFQTTVGNRTVAGFMRHPPMATPVLVAEPTVRLPSVAIYGVHAGSVEGLALGYIFWSPLKMRVDPTFVLFQRPQFQPVDAIREGAQGNNRYQLRGGLRVFTLDDDAILINCHIRSKITEVLEL